MKVKEIDAKTFDEFALTQNNPSFTQSSAWAKVNNTRNSISRLLGVYNQDELVAVALIIEKKIAMYRSFYCPRGPLTNYKDKQLLKDVFLALKDYAYQNNGLYFKFDPDLVIRKLNEDASVKETFEDYFSLIDFFKSLGFKHRGFTTRFAESSAPRFTFVVDVNKSDEELLESFHRTTNLVLKKNNPYKLEIKKGDKKDLEAFYKIKKETAVRKKNYLESYEYFEKFYDLLNEADMSDIFVVSANMKYIKEVYAQKVEELNQRKEKVATYLGKKKETQARELQNYENKLNKELKQINAIKDDVVPLSSIITAKFKDTVWLMHGGNSDDLSFLNPNYELFFAIMKDSRDNGFKYVDFYGTEGKVDPHSDIYGIYLFKQRFSGDFVEYVGEFDIVTRKLLNAIISKLLVVRRKLLIKKSIRDSK